METVDFRELANNFCNNFYSCYDCNYYRLHNLLNENTKITFAGNEFIGSRQFMDHIERNRIISFQHSALNVTAQPLFDHFILIQVDGFVSVNYLMQSYPFTDTFIIDGYSGRIFNYVFRI